MKRLLFFIVALCLAAQLAEARDLVSRDLVASPRSLRSDAGENPPSEPPPGGGGGGEEPPPETDVRGCESCTTLTATETVPNAVDRLMVIGVCQRSPTDIITSVSSSVDGALTLVNTTNNPTGPFVRANLYRLIGPTVGAHTITVSSSASQNMALGVMHLSNVDQTTPLGTVTTSTGNGNPSTSIASATQRIVIDHICSALPNEESLVPASGQEQKWFATVGLNGSFTNRQTLGSQKAGAATVQMDWAKPAARDYVHQVVDVRPPDDTGDPPEQCANCYILNKTFEDSSLTSGSVSVAGCAGGYAIATTPVRTGTKSVKITLDSTWTPTTSPECDGSEPSWVFTGTGQIMRTELDRFGLGPAHGAVERWYGFAIYLDTFVPPPAGNDGTVVSQWHTNKDECDVPKSPHLTLYITNGGVWRVKQIWDANACSKVNNPNTQVWDLGAISTGAWVDWVVYAKWSYNSDGVLKIWKDGQLVVDDTGPNTWNDQNQEFHNIGFYHSWWTVQAPSPDHTLIAYYDNWRIGNSTSSFADVDPSQ